MKNPYPYEKFSGAVTTMATSPKTIQERVGDAYLFNLSQLRAEDLPEEIQYKFKDMAEKLTSIDPVGDKGSVYATIERMSEDEAIDIANAIIHMADVVTSDYYEES